MRPGGRDARHENRLLLSVDALPDSPVNFLSVVQPLSLCLRVSLCLTLAGLVAGCASPARRAHDNPAAFGRLSPADQRLVLRGHVHAGLGRDAVLIAWGKPNDRYDAAGVAGSKEKSSREIWIYRRDLTTYGPLGSYDQWQPGNDRFPRSSGLLFGPGFGFGGSGYEGFLLYHPRVRYTDTFIRRAVFVNGKLDSYQLWHGELPPLP